MTIQTVSAGASLASARSIAIDPAADIRHLNSTALNVRRREAREPDCYAPPRKADVGDGVDPGAYDRGSRRAPLAALQSCECRWPVNDPPKGGQFLFCAEATDGSTYCSHHTRRATGAGTLSEQHALNGIARAA